MKRSKETQRWEHENIHLGRFELTDRRNIRDGTSDKTLLGSKTKPLKPWWFFFSCLDMGWISKLLDKFPEQEKFPVLSQQVKTSTELGRMSAWEKPSVLCIFLRSRPTLPHRHPHVFWKPQTRSSDLVHVAPGSRRRMAFRAGLLGTASLNHTQCLTRETCA